MTFALYASTVPLMAEKPSAGQRIVRIGKHSLYGSVTGGATLAVSSLLTWQQFFQNSFYWRQVVWYKDFRTNLIELGCPADLAESFINTAFRIGNSEKTTTVLTGATAILGFLTLYNIYKVAHNTFGMLDDALGDPQDE